MNASTVEQLLHADGYLDARYDTGEVADLVRGHNLALKLTEHGYRVNFTLMFEPAQVALALQARPTFINAFVRHRLTATRRLGGFLAAYAESDDPWFIEQLRAYMVASDYLSPADADLDLLEVTRFAGALLHNRRYADDAEGADGLDAAREALRWLDTSNLPDTRLIICSIEGPTGFPDVMRMLTAPEFRSMHDRVVITTDPRYLARWASAPHVVAYQRRFMRAASEVNGRARGER